MSKEVDDLVNGLLEKARLEIALEDFHAECKKRHITEIRHTPSINTSTSAGVIKLTTMICS